MTNRLLELAKQDLANARDNLARARLAAQAHPVDEQWGQSGQTLGEIIAGYEDWERTALQAVHKAEAIMPSSPRPESVHG